MPLPYYYRSLRHLSHTTTSIIIISKILWHHPMLWVTHLSLPTHGNGNECKPTNLAIWQQFVDLVFQDDLIKCKQNFDVIMDDTFIHSTADEHLDDLNKLFKVLRKYGLKLSPHKCHIFQKEDSLYGIRIPNSR